jgi:hypothetical protein
MERRSSLGVSIEAGHVKLSSGFRLAELPVVNNFEGQMNMPLSGYGMERPQAREGKKKRRKAQKSIHRETKRRSR